MLPMPPTRRSHWRPPPRHRSSSTTACARPSAGTSAAGCSSKHRALISTLGAEHAGLLYMGGAGRAISFPSSRTVVYDRHLFTSESVTEGHPDKVADAISHAVLDAILKDDEKARVACETLVTTGLVCVAGEITTTT